MRARSRRGDLLRRALVTALPALDLEGRALTVACSGGVDSIALTHALHLLADRMRLRLSVGHVNHALRGADSDADEAFVRDFAASLALPFASERVDPRALVERAASSRARPTLQEAARRLRADALRRLFVELGADCIATAHTADDQAETVLLRLLRGSGPQGLGGIPERSHDGLVVRPMLRASRADVVAHANAHGLSWREDASNSDPHYSRARLRNGWIPGLVRDFNPNLLRAIGDLAEAQRGESEWLQAFVELEASRRFAWNETGQLCIEAKGWDSSTTPDVLARRLARLALHRSGAGRDVTRAHIERIVRFWRTAKPGRSIELPGGLSLERSARGFCLARHLPSRLGC
jgi:tRNA(Ile)-lysidine synthase